MSVPEDAVKGLVDSMNTIGQSLEADFVAALRSMSPEEKKKYLDAHRRGVETLGGRDGWKDPLNPESS